MDGFLELGVILLLSVRFAATLFPHFSRILFWLRSSRFLWCRSTALPEALFPVR